MEATESAPSRREVLFDILKTAGREFAEDKAGRQAAALAYYTLFSLVPLLFVAVAVTAITLGPTRDALPLDPATGEVACDRASNIALARDSDRPLDRLVVQLDDVAGESVSDPVRQLICQARENAGASLSVGLAIAAFAASTIFLQVQGVLNWVFHVPEEKVKGFSAVVRTRVIAVVAAVVLATLVLIPVIAVGAIRFLVGLLPIASSWLAIPLSVAVPLVSLAMLIATVALTFRVLTRAEIPWRAARRGGAATAMTGLIAAFAVGQYLGTFASGSSTFGVLGGLAILLFFFNLMWVVYLYGAEVTKVYADYLEFGDVVAPHERIESRFVEDIHASIRSQDRVSAPGVVNASVFAFLVGVVLGRRRK
ncbi:MAG TPA: YihY/virulence factor BrkB family protein [Acidimicrobiia bacterium]|nr:YihY/virulence factor BrkB family protein [Acidimicrobiia bacterium]